MLQVLMQILNYQIDDQIIPFHQDFSQTQNNCFITKQIQINQKMKNISSDIEFDAPTQVQMCSNISESLNDQISHLQKTYTKNEFTAIIKQLGESDPLFFCEKENLEMIYDKTVQHEGILDGTLLADFAIALKEKNKQKFQREIQIYREYIQKIKSNKQTTIKSKQLLNFLYQKDEMGYLTDSVYELLRKQEEVSIKKLEELINEVEHNFKKTSCVAIPKKISLKKSSYNQSEQFQQILFEIMDKQSVDIQKFKKLKNDILTYLDDPAFSVHVEKEMNRLEDALIEINQRKIPSLKEEIINLTKFNKDLSGELEKTYEELDLKSNELYETKTKLMQLTEQNRVLSKDLINTKIELNQREQYICNLTAVKEETDAKLSQQKESTKKFFEEYKNLQNDYNNFLAKLSEEQEKKKHLQKQSNFFPSLSLKQQLQDAQFKIKRLKEEQNKLKNELENTETAYMARIQFLEQELEEAKLNVDKAENLKMQGMSRLSKNFEALRQSNYAKKSMFQSVVSLLGQSKPSNQSKKMSMFLDQVEDFLRQSKSNKFVGSKRIKDESVRNKKENQDMKEIVDFDRRFETEYMRQSRGDEMRFNFCDMDYGDLKKKWQEESPTVLGLDLSEQKIQKIETNQPLKYSLSKQLPEQTVFLSSAQVISKSGSRYKKYLMVNRKGMYMFDTKLRLQKQMKFTRVSKITFNYFNMDCLVVSFKRKENPMKKRITNIESDMIFRCLRCKELVAFLGQPLFTGKVLKNNRVHVLIQKEENIWIRESTQKDVVLSNCGNFYSPFRINLSLKNHLNDFFYAQLSRENFFSRSYIIICIVEQFGVYCFEWTEDEMEKEKRFIYLLPLVKRMLLVRETESVMVKIVYEDWSDGKTFLLRFKNYRESLKFVNVCQERLKKNLDMLEARRKMIEDTFLNEENNILEESVEESVQKLAIEEAN